jgi:hypothetical protein
MGLLEFLIKRSKVLRKGSIMRPTKCTELSTTGLSVKDGMKKLSTSYTQEHPYCLHMNRFMFFYVHCLYNCLPVYVYACMSVVCRNLMRAITDPKAKTEECLIVRTVSSTAHKLLSQENYKVVTRQSNFRYVVTLCITHRPKFSICLYV